MHLPAARLLRRAAAGLAATALLTGLTGSSPLPLSGLARAVWQLTDGP